jgi:hypothetical protein
LKRQKDRERAIKKASEEELLRSETEQKQKQEAEGNKNKKQTINETNVTRFDIRYEIFDIRYSIQY